LALSKAKEFSVVMPDDLTRVVVALQMMNEKHFKSLS